MKQQEFVKTQTVNVREKMGENMYSDALKFVEYLNEMAEYEKETVARAAAISADASMNTS